MRGLAALALVAALAPASAWAETCDLGPIEAAAREVDSTWTVESTDGVVFVTAPGTPPSVLAVVADGTLVMTSTQGKDEAAKKALGDFGVALASDAALTRALGACTTPGTSAAEAAQARVDAERPPPGPEVPAGAEDEAPARDPWTGGPLESLAGLVLALALGLWATGQREEAPPRPEALPLAAWVLVALGTAGALALALTTRPFGDELAALSYGEQSLLGPLYWADRSDPYWPAGGGLVWSLWLRLFSGVVASRILAVVFQGATLYLVARLGQALLGRAGAIALSALSGGAAYALALGSVGRPYSLLTLAATGVLLAVVHRETPRPRALFGFGLLGLWTSFLLWPLVFAAPVLIRLERRVRFGLLGAFGLQALALVPRVFTGVATVGDEPAQGLTHVLDIPGAWLTAVLGDGELGVGLSVFSVLVAVPLVVLGARRLYTDGYQRLLLLLSVAVVTPFLLLVAGIGIDLRYGVTALLSLRLLAAAGGVTLYAWRRPLGLAAGVLALSVASTHLAAGQARRTWHRVPTAALEGAELVIVVPAASAATFLYELKGTPPGAPERNEEWGCDRVARACWVVDGVRWIGTEKLDAPLRARAHETSTVVISLDGPTVFEGLPPSCTEGDAGPGLVWRVCPPTQP